MQDDGKVTPKIVHKSKIKWDDRERVAASKRLATPVSQAPVERLSRTANRNRVTPRGLRQTYKGNKGATDIESWLFQAPSARLQNKA